MPVRIKHIASILEEFAPLSYQESYDNAGLQVGNPNAEVNSALVCIDVTEAIVDEAITLGAGLIISHHPLIFGGLKRLTGATFVERTVMKAITNNIAIYSSHTNLDSVSKGVNAMICQKLGLQNTRVLSPAKGELSKLVTYVPLTHADIVREVIFEAGAGCIGNYDCCSYNIEGYGTFRGNDSSTPFVGKKGELHKETEIRLEVILPSVIQSKVVKAMLKTHPYEEVAYDLIKLENQYYGAGAGMIGELPTPSKEIEFLQNVKKTFGCQAIKHSPLRGKEISRVAVCGGSGSHLIKNALHQGADIFITGDIKYHDFFIAENQIVITDIGHYESENFTKDLFYDILTKKITNFAVHLTGINTNPITYL